MENQYSQIKGCRELLALQAELASMIGQQHFDMSQGAADEFERFNAAEPMRWANICKTDIQTGVMALVRAVAQPEGI